jgi:hypothetical protein
MTEEYLTMTGDMRLAPWICATLAVAGLYYWHSTRDIGHGPGVIASQEPWQRRLPLGAGIDIAGFRLMPRADFRATVRVLHREDYSSGPLAELVPTDFAVGWGPMSDSRVLTDIEISQSNRFYYWRTQSWPLSRQDIERHSANWHVIAANDAVRDALSRLRAGSLVELRGRLVDIEGRETRMRTSLTRSDTGAGACEILLAHSVRVLDDH